MNIIAFDIASEVTTLAVLRGNGKLALEGAVETSARALREAIKNVPRPRQVVFEECTQAAWLWTVVEPISDDVLVCDPRKLRRTSEQKNDVIDARTLAERARSGELSRVWHGGKEFQELQYAVTLYLTLTRESTRLKNQIRSVFRSRGAKDGRGAYDTATRKQALKALPDGSIRRMPERLATVLDTVTHERALALKEMIVAARKHKTYAALRRIDGIGPIYAAILVAEIGNPQRFRSRRQFWSYSGLAVRTFDSSEYEIKNGRIVRKKRKQRTRGLVKAYNRNLKCVFKQAALTVSRTRWSSYYERLLKHSKNSNNVQLTIARKIAAVVLHIAKTGEKYDVIKAFKQH